MLIKFLINLILIKLVFGFLNKFEDKDENYLKLKIKPKTQNKLKNKNLKLPIKFDEETQKEKYNYHKIEFDNSINIEYDDNYQIYSKNDNFSSKCNQPFYSCKLLKNCSINRFEDIDSIKNCTLGDKRIGICCPSDYTVVSGFLPPISYSNHFKFSKPFLQDYEFDTKKFTRFDSKTHKIELTHTQKVEKELTKRNLLLTRHTAALAHQNFHGYFNEAQRQGRQGERLLQLALEIAQNNVQTRKITFHQHKIPSSISKNSFTNLNNCSNFINCPNEKYRSPNGFCNNKKNPKWGKSMTTFNRVLDPDYGDDLNSPRESFLKNKLPNARKLSVALTRYLNLEESKFTLACMQFGQFINHDFSLAALTRTESGKAIDCCNNEIQKDQKNLKHPACFEIKISKNDPFYKKFNVTCMNFVRSLAGKRIDCNLGPREQLNQLTSFIDASMIYGSSLDEQKNLRKFQSGQLLSSLINNAIFLPTAENGTCNVPRNDLKQCFRSGDIRTNENIHLTVMHTLFLREHNRIALELEDENPHWSDEKLFQETRLIIGAIIQHITYNEFLPVILGKETMLKFNLYPKKDGHINSYDQNINPTLFAAFSASAYRFHSMVQGYLHLKNNKEVLIGKIPLAQTFNNPSLLRKHEVFDGLINGMASQPMQEQDTFFTNQITNHLFQPFNSSFGLDLYAINVQRGRDHGLPGYNSWRKICGLESITNFYDLEDAVGIKVKNVLKENYESIDDIDLFVAGVSEKKLPYSQLGPTFACIVGEQFRRLKFGDRFYYENANQLHSFSPEKLKEIKSVTLARIFCDNGDKIKFMQPNVFITTKYWWNKRVSCNDIPSWSLKPWFR